MQKCCVFERLSILTFDQVTSGSILLHNKQSSKLPDSPSIVLGGPKLLILYNLTAYRSSASYYYHKAPDQVNSPPLQAPLRIGKYWPGHYRSLSAPTNKYTRRVSYSYISVRYLISTRPPMPKPGSLDPMLRCELGLASGLPKSPKAKSSLLLHSFFF